MKLIITIFVMITTLIFGNMSLVQASIIKQESIIKQSSGIKKTSSVKWCVVNNSTGKIGQCYRMKQICENSIKSVKNYYSCVAR